MTYVVKASAPGPISADEQARIRKAAWDANRNWWATAIVLFVLALPSIMNPEGLVCLAISIIVFVVTLIRVDADYAAAISGAADSCREAAERHAQWQTELAAKQLGYMGETRDTLERQLRSAVAALAKARDEFAQKVYTLFWENVERAAAALMAADASRGALLRHLGEYKKLLQLEQHTFPSSPAPTIAIPDQSKIERELRELIRAGLRNEKFAAVWESWRGRHDSARTDRFVAQL